MKKLILVATVAALAACSGKAPEAATNDTAATNMEASADTAAATQMALDGKTAAGTYTATSPDGRVLNQTVTADGKLVTVEGDKTTNGTWTSSRPEEFCITNDGEAKPTCYTESMDAKRGWIATNVADPKDTWDIKRVA
ncbi:MAG: hypothetical protein ABI626_06005 [Sphingomicrobium sp.]